METSARYVYHLITCFQVRHLKMNDKAEYANYPNEPEYAGNLYDGPAQRQSKLHSIELWLADNIIEHLSFGITLVFAFACWFFTDDAILILRLNDNIKKILQSYGFVIIIILIILIIIIYYLQNRQKQRNSKLKGDFHNLNQEYNKLKSENYQLNDELSQTRETIRSLCEGYLYSLANGQLKFASVPHCYERITLYAHDYDHFIPIGRVSFAPEYAKKGRPSYPEGEGCIAQAWKNIWHFANDYPDPEVCPNEYSQ